MERAKRPNRTSTIGALLAPLWSVILCASVPAQTNSAGAPARLIGDVTLHEPGFGQLTLETLDGKHLNVHTYRASAFDPTTDPIWFVMHGASRNAERYIHAAAPVAERHNALAVVVRFSRDDYPRGSDYTLGLKSRDGSGWRRPSAMLYAEIERAFDAVCHSIGGRQKGYYLFGHSAGAQFTHRLLTFLPEHRVLGAVAANAGWYTLPVADRPRDHTMPYGLRNGPTDHDALGVLFDTPLVIILGENDTTTADTDDLVRGTREARAQGENRLERGRNYFAVARDRARELDEAFAWRLAVVPRAGHDAAEVIDSAGYLLFDPAAGPCDPTPVTGASGLVFTEILADPPHGAAGDANGDGVRDPAEDEFVEIVNTGAEPICLSGWTLGDADNPARHVFPLGPALEPGQLLVVFGGGVPTGEFGGALVQWAEDGLSLSNTGDVLTLRDADDAPVCQVSWGDCDGESRAEDHWLGGLGIDGSIARACATDARWAEHLRVWTKRFSPGSLPEPSEASN